MIIALSRKIGLRKKHSYQRPCNWLRYSILALTFATATLGSLSVLNLLDPYSLTGRIVTLIIGPVVNGIYNTGTSLLKYFDFHLFTKNTVYAPTFVVVVTLAFLCLIVIMSARAGRLYCNSVCPLGALLGLISRVSFFKFTLEHSNCNGCVRCVKVCKGGCIDVQNKTIDPSRCVGCFDCLAACPQSIVNYHPSWRRAQGVSWSPARRGFLIGSVAAVGSGLLTINSDIRNLVGTVHASPKTPITPPGSVSVDHFTKACTACHLCVSACPTKVITPSFLEYGVAGLLQPLMNYSKSSCEYECNICSRVCPTGAILPISLEEKKLTQIGKVELFKDKCIVYKENKNCGACGEFCPTNAIFSVNKNNVLYPETDDKYCIGCGVCEKACPTTPKSIVVHSQPVHKKAEKYEEPAAVTSPEKTSDEDFPF